MPTKEQTIFRLKRGIKFAYPFNYRVLKTSIGKLSLEEISGEINSFTFVNEITALSHPVEENNFVASFAARGNYNRSE